MTSTAGKLAALTLESARIGRALAVRFSGEPEYEVAWNWLIKASRDYEQNDDGSALFHGGKPEWRLRLLLPHGVRPPQQE